MRIMQRLLSIDSELWSDVKIAGVHIDMKRYLLALIPAVIVFQVWFDWTIDHNIHMASLATYKPMIDMVCTAFIALLIMLLLGLAIFGRLRSRVAQ